MLSLIYGSATANGAVPDYITNPKNYKTVIDQDAVSMNGEQNYSLVVQYTDQGFASETNRLSDGAFPATDKLTGQKPVWRGSGVPAVGTTAKGYTQGQYDVSVYYTEWAVYKVTTGISPSDLSPFSSAVTEKPWFGTYFEPQAVSHVQFGFIPICGNRDDGSHEQGALCTVNDCTAPINPMLNLLRACAYAGSEYDAAIFDAWGDFQPGIPLFYWFEAMKTAYPDKKIIMSVGGWTLSKTFYRLDTDAKIEKFAYSLGKLAGAFRFIDGFDFDWEVPGGSGGADDGVTTYQYTNHTPFGVVTGGTSTGTVAHEGDPAADKLIYNKMVRKVKEVLGTLQTNLGRTEPYELTIAVNCDVTKMANTDFVTLAQDLDAVNLMTYDFSGAWTAGGDSRSSWITNQTNLYPRPDGINMSSVHDAVEYLRGLGVPMNKLAVGVAMYARGWSNMEHGQDGVAWIDDDGNTQTGHDWFDGSARAAANGGCKGIVQRGVLDYSAVAMAAASNDCTYFYDSCAEAPQLSCTGSSLEGIEVYTYDNPRSVFAKGKYVRDNGLKGLFAWAYDQDNGEILNAMNEALGNAPIDGVKVFPASYPDRPASCGNSETPTGTPTDAPTDGPTQLPGPVDLDAAYKVYVEQCGLVKDTTKTITCAKDITPLTFTANKEWVDACNAWFPVLIGTAEGYPKDCATAITNFKANHPNGCDCAMSQ